MWSAEKLTLLLVVLALPACSRAAATGTTQLYLTNSTFAYSETPASQVAIYDPPLGNTSMPALTMETRPHAVALALDAGGDLAVACDPGVEIFRPPLMKVSQPSVTISNDGAKGIALDQDDEPYITNSNGIEPTAVAFDSADNLYVADIAKSGAGKVVIYHRPFDDASPPIVRITNGVRGPTGLALDSAGNLYVANRKDNDVAIYHPPFKNSSSPNITVSTKTTPDRTAKGSDGPQALALDSTGTLYVALGDAVAIFRPPLTNASSPGATLKGLNDPRGVATDPDGTLYVTEGGSPGKVAIYDPPFGDSSSPNATISSGLEAVRGVALH